jgi:dephospho-CoA kinase
MGVDMGAWPGKYVIGLTGNIATGKSVVRRMLENLGAFGIDADTLAHRLYQPGAPGYTPLVAAFGQEILKPEGQIDRGKLGKLVFNDPSALNHLESILHPLVSQVLKTIIARLPHRIIVIEAIKLIESGLAKGCDSLWVTDAPQTLQVERLIQTRGLSKAVASQRINAQPPQVEKTRCADVIVNNAESYLETWQQVVTAWEKTVPADWVGNPTLISKNTLSLQRANPDQATHLTQWIDRQTKSSPQSNAADFLAKFREKAWLILTQSSKTISLFTWKTDNFISRIDDIILADGLVHETILPDLIAVIEELSLSMLHEIILMKGSPSLASPETILEKRGFYPITPQRLPDEAWREAGREMNAGPEKLYAKFLPRDLLLPGKGVNQAESGQ